MRGHVSKRRMLCGGVVALRPTLSRAGEAKAAIQRTARQIALAKAKGDAAEVERLEGEYAWRVMNSMG